MVRIIYKFVGENDDDRQDLISTNYVFNTKMLYFLEEPDNYRAISGGVSLSEIVSKKQDDPLNGDCCVRVEKSEHLEISNYDFKGYCFHLDMK